MPLTSLAPADVRQRSAYLRAVDIPPALGAYKTVVSGDGASIRRPETAADARIPVHRSGGLDVTGNLEAGGLSISRRLGEPWTARYTLRLSTGIDPEALTDEAGVALLTEDGREFEVDGSDPGLPGLLELVRMSAPTETYRDFVLRLDPVLYWPLDEAQGRAEVDDHGNAGVNRGEAVRERVVFREAGAVPYGGAARLLDDDAVSGPGLASASSLSIMYWFRPDGDADIAAGGLDIAHTETAMVVRGVAIPVSAGWHHAAVTASTAGLSVYLDGVLAGTGAAGGVPGGPLTLGGEIVMDEFSVHSEELTAAQVSEAYDSRAGERLFQGVVKRFTTAGRGADSDRLIMTADAVGLDEALKVNRARREFTTDGSETVREVMQRVLDTELPDHPITADGVDVDDLVSPFTENLDTVHRVFTRLSRLYNFVWHCSPMGEIIAHHRVEAPASGVVLDETINLASDPPPMTVDARLFRSQQTMGAAGGRAETDTFTSNGSQRVFRLSYDADFTQGLTVEVDGSAQSVDAAGDYSFSARFAADDGTNSVLIPTGQPIPASGSKVTVRYRSTRAQVVSVADVDAIRRYGIRTAVTFDGSPNVYSRLEAQAAAFLASNATPTRTVVVKGRTGLVPLPTPGTTYVLSAPNAYGIDGGDPWLCVAASCSADARNRAKVTLDLQQGPFRPLRADYYDDLAEQDAKLIQREHAEG